MQIYIAWAINFVIDVILLIVISADRMSRWFASIVMDDATKKNRIHWFVRNVMFHSINSVRDAISYY